MVSPMWIFDASKKVVYIEHIPPESLNRVPASAGVKGRILTSAEWQVTLCDPIWYVSFP